MLGLRLREVRVGCTVLLRAEYLCNNRLTVSGTHSNWYPGRNDNVESSDIKYLSTSVQFGLFRFVRWLFFAPSSRTSQRQALDHLKFIMIQVVPSTVNFERQPPPIHKSKDPYVLSFRPIFPSSTLWIDPHLPRFDSHHPPSSPRRPPWPHTN